MAELSANGQKVYDHVKSLLNKAKPYGNVGFDTSVGIEDHLFVVKANNSIWVRDLPLKSDLEATGVDAKEFDTCLVGLVEKGLLVKEDLSPSPGVNFWYHGQPVTELKAEGSGSPETMRLSEPVEEETEDKDL